MRYTALVALLAPLCVSLAPAQSLEPFQRFDNTVGPAVYVNPSHEKLTRLMRRAVPSRRGVLPSVLEKTLPPLTAEELRKLNTPGDLGGRPYLKTVGVHRQTGVDLQVDGRWQSMSSGERIFRVSLRSPNAEGIRLHFENFHVGSGRVWIHDGKDETEVFGPYTGDGPWKDGAFWSDYILAETITVEFEPAADFHEGDPIPFTVREISHLADAGSVMPRPSLKSTARSAAAACHLDASCYPEWQLSAKGVARMLFEVEGGAATCSGTLLNTRTQSNVPWFITADHCISDESGARSLQIFWFYQTASCNGVAPDGRSVPRMLGASYVAGIPFAQGDATLLRLREIPDGVVLQGWSPENVQLTGQVTGIHHPDGSHRRISFGSLRQPVPYQGIEPGAFLGVQLDGGGLTQPGSSGSALFAQPGVLIGMLSHGPKLEESEYCARLPFPIAYGRFSLFYPVIRQYLEGGPPANTGTPRSVLTSGSPVSLNMPSVETSTLFGDTFEINVPQGATRLDIRVSAPAQIEVGVLARFGQAPVLENGQAVADSSKVGAGTQTITLSPPRAGTYFIRLALITTRMPVTVELSATVATGPATNPGTTPGGTSRQLASGQAVSYQFSARPNPVLYNGSTGFTVQVPSGAERLEIQIRTDTPNVDVDLYARRGQDVTILDGRVAAEYRSEGFDGNETLVITSQSQPALVAGTYYIALAVLDSNIAITGQIRATITAGAGGGTGGTGTLLISGQARTLDIPALQNPSIFNGAAGFRIEVPAGATQLEVTLRSSAQADVDLFVRANADVAADNGRVTADWSSENLDSNERVVITGANLRPGTYYIALVQFTRDVPTQVVLTATVTGGSSGGSTTPGGPSVLTPGRAANFRIGPVESPTLFNGEYGFLVRVPEGATRVDINLRTATPNADVDLYVRRSRDIGVENGRPVADHASESESGQESIVIDSRSTPPLQPGDYYISLGLFSANVQAAGTTTATVVTGGSGGGTQPGSPTALSPGQPARFQLPAVDRPTLFNGNYSFVMDVPQGASRLQISLSSEFPRIDTDLYVRYDAQPELVDGNVVADYTATTDFANETLVISPQSSPALRPGRYFISIATFTTGAATTGTITATVARGIFSQTQSEVTKLLLQEQSTLVEATPFVLPQKSSLTKLQIKQQISE